MYSVHPSGSRIDSFAPKKKSVWPTGIARLGANWCGPKKTDGWRESSEGKVIWEESLVYLLGEVQGARVSLCFFLFFVFFVFFVEAVLRLGGCGCELTRDVDFRGGVDFWCKLSYFVIFLGF